VKLTYLDLEKINHLFTDTTIKNVKIIDRHIIGIFLKNKSYPWLIFNLFNAEPSLGISMDHALVHDLKWPLHPMDHLLASSVISKIYSSQHGIVIECKKEDEEYPIFITYAMVPYRPYLFIKKNEDIIYHSLKSSVILEQKHIDRLTIFDIKELALSTIFHDYRLILDKLITANKRKLLALMDDKKIHEHHLIMKDLAESLYEYSDSSIPIKEINDQYQLHIPLHINSKKILIEYLFHHYKKAKKGLQMIVEQSQQTKQFIEELTTIHELCSDQNVTQLNTIKSFLEKHHILKTGKPLKEKVQALSPYQISYNGTKISFGKNQKQNHHLTFHLAQKKHIFVHIKDVSGSHIIIHHATFDHALLLFAGQLALHLSKKQSGEITYAKVGSLKATSVTGQVHIKDFKTLKVNRDFNLDFDKILRESTRY
jgi:hypothetical protein